MAAEFKASNPDYAKVVRDSFARQGLMTTLGARIVTIEPGFCVIEMEYAPGVSQLFSMKTISPPDRFMKRASGMANR